MQQLAATSDFSRTRLLPIGRLVLISIALLVAVASGCNRLRLPAIDPTGSRLFSPLPTTTTLAIPGLNGEKCGCLGCKSGLGCLNKWCKKGHKKPKFSFPTPVFQEPADPPACPTPQATTEAGASNEPCVPSAPCNGSCENGPPAVLFGDEPNYKKHCLPKRGKRGCILLSPQKIVAPVGGEVVLLSGICGTDGYLQMNEKLEWMLAPDSVGNFIQVGDDAPGLLHRLAGARPRPEKIDPSYAIGRTSIKKMLITRGNNDARDDVQLEKGQTWLTISSPSEGTSHVTVLAPESECWDQRKATATIYWVDARWQFPGPEVVAAGQPVNLTTRVTRSEGSLPARGWKVRYEIRQPELATFAGTGGASVVEATVDDSGNASVQLIPNPGTSGITPIDMQVIRPGGESDNLPTMTLGSGQTFVTWSSPKLALRAGAPSIASYDVPVQVVANVSNPGNQNATNVRVDVQIPPGARVTSADDFAQVLPNSVTWEIGTIPPQTQLDLFMEVATQSTIDLGFQARGDGLVAEDTVRIDVFRPSLSLKVEPLEDRVESGRAVTFNIDVTNTGDRPLQNVYLTATGDSGMIGPNNNRKVETPPKDGPLQPGETWGAEVTFTPAESGRRCIDVEARADGGQRAQQQSCITVINPVPRNPKLEVLLEGRDQVATGQTTLLRAKVGNAGQAIARNVNVSMVYDPQLQLLQATEGADQSRVGQNMVTWTIPSLEPGQTKILEGEFNVVRVNPRARVSLTAQSSEGLSANTDFVLNIIDGTPPPRPEPPAQLPPAGPTPEIPGGAAPRPLQGAPEAVAPAPNPQPQPQRSDRLQARLFGRDNPVRVNDPIRYALRIVNDSDVRDGQVGIQFQLPDGVRIERVVPMTNPELGEYQVNAGIVSLAYIRSMNPGESVEYELVLTCNQSKTFDLNVQVRSLRMPDGFVESVTTEVQP